MTTTNKIISVVDILKVPCDPDKHQSAVKTFSVPAAIESIPTIECDILIVGGSFAGLAAILSAAAPEGTAGDSIHVCCLEETDWLGGQMTAQGVPNTDDGRNFQVETSGSNRSHQRFREAIRNHYRQTYKLSETAKKQRFFNPGNSWYWVSQLAFEPKVAVKEINKLIAKLTTEARLQVFLRRKVVEVECDGKTISGVLTVDLETGEWSKFKSKLYIDATELGELLALSGAEYSSGTESRAETDEPTAAVIADPEQVQDYTYPFIVEFVPGSNNTIAKPKLYDHFNNQGKFSLLAYHMFSYANKVNEEGVIISELMPFWTYRRILDKTNFDDERIAYDAVVMNWYSNDFRGHNIIDKEPSVISDYLSQAKACSLSFLYWLQTEAPRDDGGKGYPEIRLKDDALGTEDGLSKYPYIRESRRGKAITIIKEQDIKGEPWGAARALEYEDSVGIGYFPIDIHGKETAPATLFPTKHFQIPLGALLMSTPTNLILSCKNIGTTHITNGAYRLHPIEWAIGEAAGALAKFSIESNCKPSDVLKEKNRLHAFQLRLIQAGVPLYWYDDVATTHPLFEAIQLVSILDLMRGDPRHLHFQPDLALSLEETRCIVEESARRFNGIDFEEALAGQLDTRGRLAAWLYEKVKKSILQSAVPQLKSS
jgi:hypothetical protein